MTSGFNRSSRQSITNFSFCESRFHRCWTGRIKKIPGKIPIEISSLLIRSSHIQQEFPGNDDFAPPTRGFSVRVGTLEAMYFNELPGRPLPNLQDNAGRCRASSRKTHAVVVMKSWVVGKCSTYRLISLRYSWRARSDSNSRPLGS